MAPRPVNQQLSDGVQSEPGQLGRPLRTDARQRRQRCVQWIGRRIGHDPIYSGRAMRWESWKRPPYFYL